MWVRQVQAVPPSSFKPSSSTDHNPQPFWTRQARPSTASSTISSRPGSSSGSKSSSGKVVTAHVLSIFEDYDERSPPAPSISAHIRPSTSNSNSTSMERGRPLAPASSWNNLRYTSRKGSKDSLRDERESPSSHDAARGQTIRRFQSLGFLRKKNSSISVAPSPSVTSLNSGTSKPGSSHGHSSSNSSSNGSQPPPATQAQVVQPKQHSHVVAASTVFPSMSPGTTFTLTLTPGNTPPSAIGKATATPSFARPPKANPVTRRSISLYENGSSKKDLPDLSAPIQRPSKKKVVPLPPTKTTVVARAPCAYDVTTVRRPRPRSSSLPLGPVLVSRAEHVDASGINGSAVTSLNTSTSELSLSSIMASPSTPSSDRALPHRAQHRFAAVYRPPPPVDANGYARPGHPKPALSLSMPSGVSIIEPLAPATTQELAKPTLQHNDSPSSANSSRPPPRAPIPVSPDASPELKPLPSLPPLSSSFSSSSPIISIPDSPWSRQRSSSAAKSPAIISNRVADNGSLGINYNLNATTNSKPSSRSPLASPNIGGSNGPSSYNSKVNNNVPNVTERVTGSSARTIYSAAPSIPINSRRRPSLPLTSTLQEQAEHSLDQADQLWGYFEKKGLTSTIPYGRSPSGSTTPVTEQMVKAPVRKNSNADRFTQTLHLPSQVHTPVTPNSMRTPPLSGGISPISPFPTRPLHSQRPGTDSGVPSDRLQSRAAPTQQLSRLERSRPTHLVSQSSAAALPSPLPTQRSFLPSPAPSTVYEFPFASPGVTLPVTPITPEAWNPTTDADSVVLPPSPVRGRMDEWLVGAVASQKPIKMA